MRTENMWVRRYKQITMPYFPQKELPGDEERPLVGAIGPWDGHVVPDDKFIFKTMDQVVFPLLHPIIHLSAVYRNRVDEMLYTWSAKNWYTMRLHHETNYSSRMDAIAENSEILVAFYPGRCKILDPIIAKAIDWGTDVRLIYF